MPAHHMKRLLTIRAVLAAAAVLTLPPAATAQPEKDAVQIIEDALAEGRTGIARKDKAVDARPATAGEVIVTIIAGEGKETQSPPAQAGDMVVRNRCPETGNEEILVAAAKFAGRYEGPTGPSQEDGWAPYRPRGIKMRYIVVSEADGEFQFKAPWGEMMVARPGDAIVQDLEDANDTYRIARAAFACTYSILEAPGASE